MSVKSNAIKVWPKVFLFGDSITQQSFSHDGCWGSLLSDHLTRRCDIVQRGFSGYNARWCKLMLPSLLDASVAKDVVAMTIFLGANDSNCFELNPQQHVPLAEYKEALKEMVEFCMSIGISREKIILINAPAFCEAEWEKECIKEGRVLTKDNKITGVYAEACCQVGQDMGTNVVDLYGEMMKLEDFKPYLNDGLHLSVQGSQLLFKLLKPIIDKLTSGLPQLMFPYWKDVDCKNPEPSLLD